MELFYAGNYVLALQKIETAISNVEQLSKAKEKDAAILLTTKAQWLSFMGDTQGSDVAFMRAQSRAETILGTNHPVVARIQLVRAEALLLRGNVSEAKTALAHAMAARVEHGGTNNTVSAMRLRVQAMIRLTEGDTAQARELLMQSSTIIERIAGPQSSLFGVNRWLEAQVTAVSGEYEKAIQLCESSLAVLTNCYGPEHLVLAHVRDSLAFIYQQAGMYEEALPLLQANLRTLEKTLGNDSAVGAITLNSLGVIQYRLGNYSEAEGFFRRCLAIREKRVGVESPAYAATLNNLALVFIAICKDDDVSTLFKDAALVLDKSLGKNSPALATVLLNWGSFTRSLGDLDGASELITEAAAIRNRAFGKDHPATAEVAEEYAKLQCDRGEFKHAMHLVSLARSIKTNFFGRYHPAMAETLSTAARVYAGMGDEYTAVSLHSTSALVRSRVFGSEHPTVGNELEAAGLALCRAGDFGDAVDPFMTALRLQKDYLAGQMSRPSADGGLRLADQMYFRTELFHSLYALGFSNAVAVQSEAAEQLASCKALVEEVQATQAALETDSRTSTRELRGRLDATQKLLDRLPENNLDPVPRDARRRQLQSAKTKLEEAIAEQNGLVAQMIRERNLTLIEVARGLPADSVLADFVCYYRYDFTAKTNRWKEQRYAAYLTFPLAKDSTNVVVQRVDLGEAQPIDAAIETITRRMGAGQFRAPDLAAALQRVSGLVYAPLAPHLTNVSHLIVCPDGQLSRLPFEMLLVSKPGGPPRYLVEEKTISYVGSGREVARLALRGEDGSKARVQSSKSLVMGNPDLDLDLSRSSRREEAPSGKSAIRNPQSAIDQSLLTSAATKRVSRSYRGIRFTALPGSEQEARGVAKLLGEDCVLRLGAEAREAELKAVVSPRVLHLATHGFFLSDQEFKRTNASPLVWSSAFTRPGPPEGGTPNDWENPLVRCGIALAGANRVKSELRVANVEVEDGLLTGLEASLLNLQGTELVILSACDSGAGEVKIGEGVMSLRRAFRIAGAETVLASHWKVSDAATSRLMTEFMRRWRAGEPRAEAWRAAQLSLLRDKKETDFSNPYFWAAFTLTGQWR